MKKYLYIIVLLFPFAVSAQKDAPVAGHAAILVDMLKKDYSAIDTEIRQDELLKDRALVISIFKSYLKDDQLVNLFNTVTSTDTAELKKYQTKKSVFNTLTSSQFDLNSQSTIIAANKLVSDSTDSLICARKKYFVARHKVDGDKLESLETAYLNENRYVAEVIKLFIEKYKSLDGNGVDKFAAANSTSSVQKSIPFIGGDLAFDVVIDGLGRFLAKRIKEELTNYVIEQVQVWLQNPTPEDPLAELKTILPRTTNYLIAFRADQVMSFPNEIKQYIEADLNNVLTSLPQLRATPRMRRLIDQHPDLDFAFEAFEVIPVLSKIKNPVDFFKALDNNRNLTRWQNSTQVDKFNIANTFRLSSLLAQSLTTIESGELRFAGIDFMGTYAEQPNFQHLYLGFLYQQNIKFYEDLQFKVDNKMLNAPWGGTISNLPLAGALKKIVSVSPTDSRTLTFRNLIYATLPRISSNAEIIATKSMEIRKANKAGVKVGADTVHHFIESILGFTEDIVSASDTILGALLATHLTAIDPSIKLKNPNIKKNTRTYFAFARTANDVVLDLKEKKYATAIIKALELPGNMNVSPALSQIPSIINRLGMVKQSEKLRAWHLILDNVGKASGSGIKTSVALNKEAFAVYEEFKKIERFYQERNTTTVSEIRDLKALILALTAPSTSPVPVPGNIKTFVVGDQFKRLVISYYSGIALDRLIDDTAVEMRAANYTDVNGVTKPVFDSDEITRVNSLIVQYAYQIFDNFIVNGNRREDKNLLNHRELVHRTIQSTLNQLPQSFDMRTHPEILKLIHFVNDMAVAKDAEGVETSINSLALPAGSYSIKRTSKFNFSLNTYPGILPAVETARKGDERSTAFSFGFTAPVGISAAIGTRRGYSWGLFVPVIDIGAVTRLRFDSDATSATLPELKFKNFISPGLYLHLGLRKTPLSIHLGGQFGPEVRNLDDSSTHSAWESIRYGVGLVMDITLLNLYTKPRFFN